MKINVLLFTQTMTSLLKTSLSLQSSLSVCSEILSEKNDRDFCSSILKKINEGNLLSKALKEHENQFSPLYISLVKIGEKTGTLKDVFEKLSDYLKTKKETRQKIIQALSYPALVLLTAAIVALVIIFFVMPHLSRIFEAFTESSEEIEFRISALRTNLIISSVILTVTLAMILFCIILHRASEKAAFFIDSVFIRLPFIGKFITALQIHDFSFSMKLLSAAYFPLVQSLAFSSQVLSNRRLRKAVLSVCADISQGISIGESFEKENLFPSYLVIWIKIAEKNGDTAGVFGQVYEYYASENANIIAGITAFAEPVFILLTGIAIIALIGQFVLPIFKMLGAL